jgi:hypothetical protein
VKTFQYILLVIFTFFAFSNFIQNKNDQLAVHQIGFTTSQELKNIIPIDLETGFSGSAIQLEFSPKAIVISEETKMAYVLQQCSNVLIPVNIETGNMSNPIILQEQPKQMVISEQSLIAYLINEDSYELSILDLKTELIKTNITLDNIPSALTLSNDENTLYIAYFGSNEITPIDLKNLKTKPSLFLRDEPAAIAATRDGFMTAVSHSSLKELDFFDIDKGTFKDTLTLDGDFETIHLTADGKRAYLTHENSTDIVAVDLIKKTTEQNIKTDFNVQGFALIEKKELEASFTAEIKTVGKASLFEAKKQSSLLGNSIQYMWDFGDDHTFVTSSSSKMHVYKNPGTYSVTLTVKEEVDGKSFFQKPFAKSATVTRQFEVKKAENILSQFNQVMVQTETTTTTLSAAPNPSDWGQNVTLTASVSSTAVGIITGNVEFYEGATLLGTAVLAGGIATFSTNAFTIGTHTLTASYLGDSTFFPSDSSPLTQVVNQATTSTAISSSLNPSFTGQTVTFTATVAVTGGAGTLTGTVIFRDGLTTIGTGTLSGSTATFATSLLAVSSHVITANYTGDANFSGSTSSATVQTVNLGIVSVAVTSTANPSNFGDSLTLQASLNIISGIGTPTGTVTFKDGASIIGSGTVSGNVATFVTSILSVGAHSITAVYGGDINFALSTSPVFTQNIAQGTTNTTVASSVNPSSFGQSVLFTSTSVINTGAGTLTGTVTFSDGVDVLGTSPISPAGIATFITSNLTVGSHSITSKYNGDTNFTASAVSQSLTQVINKALPLDVVVSSLNPSLFGDSVLFTATISSPTTLGNPTGTVSFMDGATLLGTGTLIPVSTNSSSTTFMISTLVAGTHPITAVYSGDGNFTTMTSAPLNQVVTQVSSTSTVIFSNSANPSEYGEPVILRATVTGAISAAPFSPTGTVQFYDGATLLGSGPLTAISVNAGSATLTVTTLLTGSHTITAVYLGDVNYPASTSLPMTQNVIKTGTTSTIISSANPSVFGQGVTFTTTITAQSPGMGSATGNVQFYDGVTFLGSGTLVSTGVNTSAATFVTSALTLGSHNIVSIYTGDTNFISSTAPIFKQVVNQDSTTTTLISSLNPSNFGDSITLTATLVANAPGSGTPTGSVQFFDGATLLATVNMNAGIASFSTIALYPGSHSLTARYSGDSNFVTSNSNVLTQVVNNKLNTLTTINSQRNSSPTAQAVTYNAKVTAITGVPTGTVTFYDLTNSASPIGTSTLVNGVASLTESGTSLIALGIHQIQAIYNGDANFITSTSSIFDQYVVPVDTSAVLTFFHNPSSQGTGVLTATIQLLSGGVGPIAGTVTFYDITTGVTQNLGTVNVTNLDPLTAEAVLPVNNFRFGSRTIVAIYSGDLVKFAQATSNTVTQFVQQTDMLTTNTTLSTSLTTAFFCQSVTLTATVDQTQGFYIPTGSVTFFSNNVEVGSSLLNLSGVATLTLATLPIGTSTIRATYNSDSNYAFSFSNTITQNIIANSTTTALSIIPNLASTPYTQDLFFVAKVTSSFDVPTGTVSFYDGTVLLTTIPLDIAGTAVLNTDELSTGIHTINSIYNADPCFIDSNNTLIHNVTKINPSMTLTSSPNPSTYGEDIIVTATLSSNEGVLPTGNVTFYNGVVSVGTMAGTVFLENGVANVILSNLAAGVTLIQATYSGDENFIASNLPSKIQIVQKAPTATCLNSFSPNPSQYGEIITFEASVSALAQTPTGNIVFKNGSTTIGTIPLTSCGTAILNTTNLNLGSNSITATYSGDSNFVTSTSNSLDHTIIQADSQTIVVNSTPNPSVFNSLVTFNISVGNIGTGSQIPSGTVTAFFGSTLLGTATLTNGLASISTFSLPVGVDTVIIKYAGDIDFKPSSVATTQTVLPLNTTSILTSSNNPSVSGQPVTFSVNVTSAAGIPTGTVAFLDGTVALATETLNTSGQASYTISNLSTASHTIRAVYSGSGNLSSSTSNAVSQVVNKAATTVTLTTNRNPSSFGEGVTFAAFTAATSQGRGIPTGTITFRNGSTTIGTGIINSAGIAVFAIANLPASVTPASITAVYSGDVNFLTSTSAVTSQLVNKASTQIAATATPNPANLGSSVTLNVAVTPINTGSGFPTGTVTAFYGSQVVGTATLNGSSQATFSTTTLPAGTLGIVVQYSGNTNYLASSTTLTESITLKTSSIEVTSSLNSSAVGQSVTYTAIVTSTTGTPSGIVAFFDGTTSIGNVTLNSSGIVTLTTSSLAIGSHPITALYSGDTNNLSILSSILNQTINQSTTTTSISAIQNPSEFGEVVNFQAIVSPISSNALKPTGTITFFNGVNPINTVNINVNGEAVYSTSTLLTGTNSITAVYNGDINFTTSTTTTLSQVVNKTDTQITVSTLQNPSNIGSAVNFNINVRPINTTGVFPSGTVNAFYGSTFVGTGILNGAGVATIAASNLPAGTLGIMFNYVGDTNFNTSSATISQTVNAATTTTLLASNLNPSLVGQAVTLTGTVNASSGIASGTLTFFDGSSILGVQTLNGSGIASLVTSTLNLGSHTITAVYSGSGASSASTSNVVVQLVNQASTTTTLTSSQISSTYQAPITFTAQVQPTSPGSGAATGTVTFFDGATIMGTANVNSLGLANFTTSSLTSGNHTLTATYNGSTSFAASTSALINQVVASANTVTKILSSTPNPSMFADVVTFFATVSSNTALNPTGIVSFFDGTTMIGTSNLSEGIAIFAISTFSIGTHPISAHYNGNANFNASTSSPPTAQVVNQSTITNTTITNLISSLNPSNYGDSVTFTATVTPQLVPGTPTGLVTFYSGANALATVVLTSGQASFTTSTLPAGNLNIVALYSGDINFSASTTTLIQVINPITTITSITSSLNPSQFNDSVIFTALVTSSNALVTGSITFYDGLLNIGTVLLNNAGQATLKVSDLTTGSHTIEARYNADLNFQFSTNSLIQVVNPASTTSIVLTSSQNPSKLGESVTFIGTTVSGENNVSGTLNFYDGVNLIGNAPLYNGLAIFSLATLATGSHPITAQFIGSSDFAPSISEAYTQVVIPAILSTSIALLSSNNPSELASAVTFTASVVGGTLTPTGTVSFFDGSLAIGSSLLNGSGSASLTTSLLSLGSHQITAIYSGDLNYGSSQSNALVQIVGESSIPGEPQNFNGCQLPNKFLNESNYRIQLNWDSPNTTAQPTSYRIYSDAKLTKLVVEVPENQHTYVISNVKKNKKHYYYIVAVNRARVSAAVSTVIYPKNQPCRASFLVGNFRN